MGVFESITHKEKIENLLNEVQSKYDAAKKQFERQKALTTRSLEKLGEQRIHAWADSMDAFSGFIGFFEKVDMVL